VAIAVGLGLSILGGFTPPGWPWSPISLGLLAIATLLRRSSEPAWIRVTVAGASLLSAGAWIASILLYPRVVETEVLRFTLPSPDIATLGPNGSAHVVQACDGVDFAFDLDRLVDPRTGGAYFDALIVTAAEGTRDRVSGRALNLENRGTVERPEMSLPVVLRVERSRHLAECSFLVRALPPHVERI
jgi:hypothetical protein